MALRDIRRDLQERLEAIQSQRQAIAARTEELKRQETMLNELIREEEKRCRDTDTISLFADEGRNESTHTNGRYSSPLSQFIIGCLRDGRAWPLKELRERAEVQGVKFDEGKSPGRSIHFALVGMQENGLVKMVEKGVWRIVKG